MASSLGTIVLPALIIYKCPVLSSIHWPKVYLPNFSHLLSYQTFLYDSTGTSQYCNSIYILYVKRWRGLLIKNLQYSRGILLPMQIQVGYNYFNFTNQKSGNRKRLLILSGLPPYKCKLISLVVQLQNLGCCHPSSYQ